MGSRPSVINSAPSGDIYTVQANEVWLRAIQISKMTHKRKKKLVFKRHGWKTIRIFVSSTFRDFHQEREFLVKKVFPDLRAWCESRKLYLVECDLRWGVPKDYTTEATLKACLGEIDRCYSDNVMPFFLNMTSERVGWVPTMNEIPEGLQKEYDWVEGLSMTEMEIMHGAYRVDNPNALFMIRDTSFIKDLPPEFRKNFIEDTPFASAKLQVLKKRIQDKFPDRVVHYKVEVMDFNRQTKAVQFGGLDQMFSKKVYDFFRKRIDEQYPLEEKETDPFLLMKEREEAFMKSRCDFVIGRDIIIKQIEDYIYGTGSDVPLILVGGAGTGKTSILARIADVAANKAATGMLTGGTKKDWHVFYHFVGAVPGSTELLVMLQRLLQELNSVTDSSLPSDSEVAAQLTCSALANPNTPPALVVVDALNQFDDETAAQIVSWVPKKLAPNIRCVFSMINDTIQHESLLTREPQPLQTIVHPLTQEDRKAIVTYFLDRYNKKLDATQMDALLSKKSSDNPLWLSIACEELRVFGRFRQLSDKINELPDGLLELEQFVLSRFEAENGGELLVATLSLLEVSARGLLEAELKVILGDEENLMPPKDNGDEKVDKGSEKSSCQLSAYKWAEVYRGLRTFLRPFGDSGEGRLDFYHRSLSKAVRIKYFKGSEEKKRYKWWHGKLADYFETKCNNTARKIEELPTHLIAIGAQERLEAFLTDWTVFEMMFDDEYSMKLLRYWRKGSTIQNMEQAYVTAVTNMKNEGKISKQELMIRYEKLAKLLSQAGCNDTAKDFSTKAQEIEETELGARPEKMADLYYLKALIQDEVMKLESYMYRSHLPKIRLIIEDFEKAVAIYETLPGKHIQRKLGRIYNRLSFYYSGYFLRGGDEYLSIAEAKAKSLECVDKAIYIFRKLNDELNMADCLVTKAVSLGKACPEQVKYLNEAEELILRITGGLHQYVDRLYLNMAIYFEESSDYYSAYEYFYKWHLMCIEFYGKSHPKTRRTIETLQEPVYKRMAVQQGHEVPELA